MRLIVLMLTVGGVALAYAAVVHLGPMLRERRRATAAQLDQALAQLAAADAFLDALKERAWDHRELDPALATIVIDEIRSYQRSRADDIARTTGH